MAWINDYTHMKLWDAITHPLPNFSDGLAKLALKLGHGCVDGLVQDCSISSALVMKILQSCTKPSM